MQQPRSARPREPGTGHTRAVDIGPNGPIDQPQIHRGRRARGGPNGAPERARALVQVGNFPHLAGPFQSGHRHLFQLE
jgi:hypothetical protein